MEVFLKEWEYAWVNKTRIHVPMSTQIVYAQADFDKAILTDADKLKMNQALKDLNLADIGQDLDAYKQVSDFKKQAGHRHFREEEFKYLNYCNWLCMIRKAQYLLEAFQQTIVPRIKEVKAVQKEISFVDESGSTITGFIDFTCVWEDGQEYVLDIKTSARPYDEDEANNSPQLTLYAHHEGISNVGFIVLQKAIKRDTERLCASCGLKEDNNRVKSCSQEVKGKRCGGALNERTTYHGEVQVVLGKTNEKLTDMVMHNFNEVDKLIKQGVFLKNLSSCTDWYGQKCPHWNMCFKGSMEGLEEVSNGT